MRKAANPREIEELRTRLEEAEATLAAIRSGEVDALVITGADGDKVFSLKTADHPYRVLVETMNQGAATVAADGTILYCNNRFAQILRLPLARVTGTRLFDQIHPSDREAVAELLRTGLSVPGEEEARTLGAGGVVTPVQLSVNSVETDGVRAVCLIVTDLTAQKRNEDMVASEKLARSILDQVQEAIVVCNEAGEILRLNEVARTLRDENSHRFEDAFPLKLNNQESANCFDLAAVLRGERVRGVEATLQRSSGPALELLVSAGPLISAQETVIGAVVTLTDITQRRAAEMELMRRSQELARSNADLERFAFAASHDLQEPLRMVLTYTQLLARMYREKTGPEAEQFVGYVETGAHRMRALLKDLLSYSTVIHSAEKNFRHTDLESVLFVALTHLHVAIKESGAVITNDRLPPVLGDETQLVQVLQNLIGNAIKFCKEPPPRIHLSAREVENGRVVISVKDNGVGIAPQYHEQIFGLFKRLHGKEFPGSGIGLALCKRIVELSGGGIWVESEPGQGSTFSFTLPKSEGL